MSKLHILDQSGQPLGSWKRACNHCGIMVKHPLTGEVVADFTTSWKTWEESPDRCSVPEAA